MVLSGTLDQRLVSEIMEKKWSYYVSRKFNWFVEYTQILASQREAQEKSLGFSFPTKNYLVLNGDEYYSEEDSNQLIQDCRKRFGSDGNFFDRFYRKVFSIAESANAYSKKMSRRDFSKKSNKALIKELSDFFDCYLKSFVPAWTRPDGFLETELKKRLKKGFRLKDEAVEELFKKIATAPKLWELAYAEEPLSLLRIAKQIQRKKLSIDSLPPAIHRQLERHIESYSWLKAPVAFESTAFSKGEYLSRLKYLISGDVDGRIRHLVGAREESEREYKRMLNQYRIRGRTLKLCEAARKFIFLRTYSTEASDRLFFVARNTILKEAAKRLKRSPAELVMLNPKEIERFLLEKEVDPRIIQERKKGFSIVWLNGDVFTEFGPGAIQLQEEARSRIQFPNPNSEPTHHCIRGAPGYGGFVRGTVKVLLSHRDVAKIDPGDILVASMTTPDYIAGMEKAAAFVTDEGGITCHAAILARELKKPCIIGTRNATKVLKDGDLVELDADQGIVRLLRR